MATCKKCGTQLEEGSKVCPACGASTDTEETAKQAASGKQESTSEKIAALNHTADTTDEFDKQDIEQNKIIALFSYIGFLFLIPLLAAKDSKFARFHTNQGIVLFIFDVIAGVVARILAFIPFVGWILGTLCGLLCLVLVILGIVNAVSGKAKELPIIGGFRILK